jgi:uncharacterized SAM-binding protein YcdF (DUF218 family)
MYFLLSKVLLFLLYPIIWILILFVIALLIKDRKRKRVLLIVNVLLLYVFSAPFFLNIYGHAWSVKVPVSSGKPVYSCAIILGGYSSVDGNGVGHFDGAVDRFIEGLKLYDIGEAKHLLLSGGNGSLTPGMYEEAAWAKAQLRQFNVPDSGILVENTSRNTIENAVFSKAVLQKSGLKPPYLLVTSDFHMRRAQMIFEKAGIQVVPYPCDYIVSQWLSTWSDLVPDGNSFVGWNTYSKELVGYVVDKWKKY